MYVLGTAHVVSTNITTGMGVLFLFIHFCMVFGDKQRDKGQYYAHFLFVYVLGTAHVVSTNITTGMGVLFLFIHFCMVFGDT